MAGRTVDTAVGRHVVDTGASYFTVRDEGFSAVVDDWRERGLVRSWTDTFHLSDGERLVGTKVGPVRWAGTAGLRSLVEDLAQGLAVDNPRDVTEVELLDGPPWDWRPVLSVYAAWTSRCWPDIDGVFVEGSAVVDWVADDGRRRGDGAPVLVAHTTPVFAASRLDDPASAVPHVLADVSRALGVDLEEPEWARAHRWSLASPTRHRPAPAFALTEDGTVGVCGDAWGDRSRIEAAWLSGHRLGGELAERLVRAGS